MTPDPAACREWLSLELDGALGADEERRLEACLAADPELALERRQYRRLGKLLAAGMVEVEPGFERRVLDALPAAGWETRHPRSWRLALALLVTLAAASAALVGGGSARLLPDSPFLGALAAVADLFATAAVTTITLLAASWKGAGLALSEMLAGSAAAVSAFVILVVSLNLLFLTLVRRSRQGVGASAHRSVSGDSRPDSRRDAPAGRSDRSGTDAER